MCNQTDKRVSALRRRLCSVTIVAVILINTSANAAAQIRTVHDSAQQSQRRDYFKVPAAATVRPLGRIPHGPCEVAISGSPKLCEGAPDRGDFISSQQPLNVPGLGIPLGGIGAGSFMINQAGTFGPWSFGGEQNANVWEMRALPQAAFHVREKLGRGRAIVRTLATAGPQNRGTIGQVRQRSWQSPLPAWNILQSGEGSYAALYPFGWVSYAPFRSDVSMRFYSPIIAREDRRTSLPVAYFEVRVANHTNDTDSVAVMFTMPNVPAHIGTDPTSVRDGLETKFQSDPVTGVGGVTMGAHSPMNTPDEANSEWTIAALPAKGQHLSYTTSWNANGTGADIYAPFQNTGKLPNAVIDHSASAGAISLSVTLRPGEKTTFHFALSWDFPQVTFNKGHTVWMRRYTDFYGAQETATNDYIRGSYPFHRSFQIADDALVGQGDALRDVESWWKTIAEDPDYPVVLKTAALNQLSQLVINDSFWEGGLVSAAAAPTFGRRLGTDIQGTHLFSTNDSSGGGAWFNEMDVASAGYRAYDLLFPTLERDFLRARIQATMADPNGNPEKNITHSENPFIAWTPSPAPSLEDSFMDVPSKTIFRIYAYAKLNHDDAFLKYAYPSIKKALGYLQAHVPSGSSLPTQTKAYGPNTYDVLPVEGISEYNASLYLLSLEIAIEAGSRVGEEKDYLDHLKSTLVMARSEFESALWDQRNKYYRFSSAGCYANAEFLDFAYAQTIARKLQLPDIFDPQNLRTAMNSHFEEFEAFDRNGGSIGYEIIPRSQHLSAVCPALETFFKQIGVPSLPWQPEQGEIWTGTSYTAGTAYYDTGLRFGNERLKEQGVHLASIVADIVWNQEDHGFVFDPPEGWDEHSVDGTYRFVNYARNLAIWDLIDTIKPVHIPSSSSGPR